MLGDLFQLPPIPASGAVFIPPTATKTQQATLALDMFCGDDPDSVNYFVDLDEQMRLDNSETWYGPVLQECQDGDLSSTSYCFLMGLPTRKAGSWDTSTNRATCGRPQCENREEEWKEMLLHGATWSEMLAEEERSCPI